MKRLTVKELFAVESLGKVVLLKGWLRSVRKSKNVSFLVLNDGTSQINFQIVVEESLSNYEEVSNLLTGACISAQGEIVQSMGKGQSLEMKAHEIAVIGLSDSTYPLQKKATSLEFLREQGHLRIRTNTYGAVFRVRHALAYATHEFFNQRGFYYIHTPIITGSDCEGAGEMFQVTTLNLKDLPKNNNEVDFSQDYFGKSTNLTVSGQLNAECYAMGLGSVYTFGPTFRAENSNTPRHLSEFWMIEPEVAFADLDEIAQLAADYIKHLISSALSRCPLELEFFQTQYAPNLIETLKQVVNGEFKKVPYTEAIEILKKAQSTGHKFEYRVDWNDGLQTEHERYLSEIHFKGPVIVTDYPKHIKAFYMKQNTDGKTVRAMDILLPGIGELVGGSQREDRYDVLKSRIEELGQKIEDYWWYLDLRRFGSAPHSGFGLGFERAVMYITGMTNIRDVVPFPRFPKNAHF